jgi:HTH-type transcriptional regulator, sugar sensing transcriptional regulator
MLTKIFEELGLSPLNQRVITELMENGASPARQLADRLNIPRPSVYDQVKILIKKELVVEKIIENKKVFVLGDIKNIQNLLDEKIKRLEVEKQEFEKSLPSLIKQFSFIEPQIRFYTGKDGMKQAIGHIVQNRDIETILMWPMSEMMKVLGSEYLEELNVKRIKRNISLRVIWPKNKSLDFKNHPYLGTGKAHLRELRFAPKEMSWDMGYWSYEDKVVFLSSEKEGFGFVVQSRDFANLIKVQFDQIWKISEPAKEDQKSTDAFLKDHDLLKK